MNITPISFQMTRSNYQIKKNENHTSPSFQGFKDGIGKNILATKALAASLGIGTAVAAYGINGKNSDEIKEAKEKFEARKMAVSKKLNDLNYFDNPDRPHLWSNILEIECRKPIRESIITAPSLDIIEKVVDNEAFSTNQELLYDVLDAIIQDFAAVNNIYQGIIFKPDILERAGKIQVVMEAYLKTPEAQQSEIMQKAIPYIMTRAADAMPEDVARAFMVISQPNVENKTYNKDEVDELLYAMDTSKRVFRPLLQPEDMQERLEHARREIDKLSSYRHCKTCFSRYSMAANWEINSVNLPVVEKFLENKELNQNEKWIEKIPHTISEINANIDYFNAEVGKSKAERIIKEMDNYIADKEAHNNPEKAKQYFDNITEIIYLTHK